MPSDDLDSAPRFADVAVVQHGKWLVAAESSGRRIRLWATDRSQAYLLVRKPGQPGGRLVFGPDGKWLVTGDHDRTALADADGNPTEDLLTADLPHHPVAVSPDGEWLAAATGTGSVRLWSAGGTQLAELPGHEADPGPSGFRDSSRQVHGVAISPDGTWLATGGSDHAVRLWDTGGTLRAVLTGHGGAVTEVAISPDGTWLASSSTDDTIRLWHAGGDFRAQLVEPAAQLAISPDSRRLAVVGRDRAIRIWEATTLTRATTLRVGTGLTRLAWFPDGDRIAACGEHGLYVLRANDGSVDWEPATFSPGRAGSPDRRSG